MLTPQGIKCDECGKTLVACDECGQILQQDQEQMITIYSTAPIFVVCEIGHIRQNADLNGQHRIDFCDLPCLTSWFFELGHEWPESLEVG